MDLNKLAQELGGKPVTDLDSLASELGGQVASTPGGYGAGTVAKDVGKLVSAGAVKGIAGAPETVQAVGSETARNTLFGPSEALNLIADPRRLANKLVGAVGLPPVFEVTKEQPLVPAEVTEKQKLAVNETLAKGKIPQLRQLTEYGNKLSQDIENTVSPEMRLAMAESQPTGNIIKALETGDFSELSMGTNPTALGLAGQAVKVFGSSAPALLVAMVTKSAGPATAVGFGQAGAEGIDEARNYVKSMSDEELTKKSEYFRNLVTLGYSPKDARLMTEDKAADTAALYQGSVGALGSAFTTKLIQGGFDKALLGNVKSRLGKIVQGTAIAGAEGALTEAAEGIATDLGIDKTIVREIGVDSFANLVLGAIGEAAPGVIRGAVAPGEAVKGAEAPESKAAPTPAAVQPPVAVPSAVITEEELETDKGLTPVSPTAPPAAPAAVTPSAEPRQIDQITARLDELEAEFKAIDDAYATATPDQFGSMTARQGQIKTEMSQLIQAATTGAPVPPVEAAVTPTAPVEVPAPAKVVPTTEETLAKLKKDQAAAKVAKEKREVIEEPLETLDSTNPENIKKVQEIQAKIQNNEELSREDYSFNSAVMRDVIAKEEKLDSPTISKKSVIPHASIRVGPFGDGFVSSYSYNEFKKGFGVSTPLDMGKIYPTRQEAIDSAAKEIRGRAEQDGNKTALNWLNTVSTPVEPKTQAEINRERQAEKKAKATKPAKLSDAFSGKDLVEMFVPEQYKKTSQEYVDANIAYAKAWEDMEKIEDKNERQQFANNVTGARGQELDAIGRKLPQELVLLLSRGMATKSLNEQQEIITAYENATAPQKPAKKKEVKKKPAEKKAEEKFVTDDEGEKLDFPLFVDMADKGYKILSFDNPRAYADKGGNKFRTMEKDGVRLAIDHRKVLFKQQGKESGRVQYGYGKEKDITFEHLIVDPSKRKQGLAKQAIQDLIDVADKNGYTLYLEPAQLEKQGMTKEQLSALYSKYGFVATNESGTPMEREPGAKAVPAKVEKAQAKVEEVKEFPKETPVSKEYQIALNKSRKAFKAFESAQDGYRKRLINDEEFLAARKRYDEAMAEYDIAYTKEAEKPEPVKAAPKKAEPKKAASSEEEQLIQDAVLFAKAADRTNMEEDRIREIVENARKQDPDTVITKLKGSVDNLKKQAQDNLIRKASQDYRDQIGKYPSRNADLINAVKGGALNIADKDYADAFYRAYSINPDKIKKPTTKDVVESQIVKFESGIFPPGEISKPDYVKAAIQFLQSPLTAKIPGKNQEKIDSEDIKDVVPLPIEKKIAVKNKTYEDHKAALSDITAVEDVRNYLKGIYLDKANNRMMATDGHRGAIINNANFDGAPKITKGKDIVALDNSIIEGQFPDMDRVVPKKHLVKSDIINTKELGDYARGVQKAWRYVSSRYNPVMLKIGGKDFGFNSDYIVDMSNLFARMGYDTFQASVNENGRLFATSPDNRVQQVVMAMREPSTPFSTYAPKKAKQITKQPETIDVEATEITEEQIMLLTDQTSKLSSKEMAALEEHYGVSSDSDKFFQVLREDVIKYVNKGADAVDAAIRSIIAKLQAGVLAVAIIFNPTFMSEPSAVVFPSKPGVEQVIATVPESAKDMSDGAKKAYATLYPALQEGLQSKDKLFTIVDKPTSKMYVFNPDGSLLVKDNVLLGKALGDTYVGQTQFKENQITPAGLIKAKAEKGSATYDGKTVYTFGNVKEGWSAVFMHAVYLKEADAEARKKALETGKDTRLSYGCINAKPELMAKIAENNRMDGSHVFIVPDDQTMVDDYIANTVPNEDLTRETVEPLTRTTQAPEKPSAPKVAAREEKAVEQKTQTEINRDRQLKRLAQREKPLDKPYYNDFTSNIDYQELFKRAKVSREDRIKEYAQTRAASRRALKKIAKYGSDIPMQRELNELLNKEEMLKAAVSINKPKRNSAADFMARATQEMANENLAPEVEAVIRQVYEKYPNILEGLRLSIRTSQAGGNEAGNLNPYTRVVTLWKDSSGVENPSTVRHELTHSLEQMMTPEARQAVVEAWARSFETAIKRNTDKKSQEFFNKVFDFLDSPSKESFDAATSIMPSYDLYQYMNPSEYWAVNAEKLMAAKLGTPWARFVSAVKKLLEALKSVFGVDNTFTVHKEFDNIINGKLERTKDKEMLTDYLFQGKVKLDFLNSIEDVNELLEKHNRPDAPKKPSLSVRDAFMGGYENTKETVKDVLTSPLVATNNMIGQADRALTYFRNKNIFFGYGLEEADRQRYGGQVRNAHQQAIASLAVVNALHSGNVATRVMTEGKLIFDKNIQMFVAEKSDKSMANVVREKAKLIDKLGFDTGNRVIQSYFEAKRSRSIVNEYLNREAAYEAAIESGQKEEEARKDLANIEKALEKVQMDDEAMDDFIALENQYPELRKMMDNWTSVNQNMIDMMEFSGIISKQRAKSLRNIEDYVPWYRIMDDQEDIHSAPKNTRGLTNVAADKKFGPGKTDRDIDDIVDNMIHNVLTITRNTARNYAANRIVMEYGERYKEGKNAGKLRVFPKEGSDADGVRFNIIANGRRIVVRIQDPLVAEAVIGMENIDIPMNGALAFMANTLRRSITTFPAFQVAQLIMDAPTAAFVTGLKRPDKVWAGVFTSFVKNLRKDDPIVTKFRNAGIGGYQSSARTPEKEIQLDIGLVQGSWFSKAMKGLDRFGDASDYAQRRSVYLQTMKETGDEMLAYFQANNVIDFKKRGSGQLAQLVTRQVAFMNAYAQSIDVLAKGLAGTGLKGISRKKAFARMLTAGMLLASATIVYCMLVGDDDEYNKLDDQTKMRNIFIPGLDMRLPMHSGAAFFFKAIPELIYNAIMKEGTKDEYDRKRLTRALSKAAVDSLIGPNVTPTGVKPFIEIALNRNFFTGGQVTPRGMEDLAAARQYNQNTSELGKIISSLTGTEKTRLLNPIEADHLVRGLTGTIGAAVMWGTNLLAGDRPTPQAKDNPFYGQFIMPDVPRGREDLYYDLKSKTDEAYKTYMDLQKKQRKEEAAEWFKENKKLIQVYGYTSSIEADLKRINGEIRRLSDLPSEKMSPDAKRKRMTEFQELKGRILKDVISMRKRAGLDESYL